MPFAKTILFYPNYTNSPVLIVLVFQFTLEVL